MLRPEAYPHPVSSIQLLQTHMSWVLLTGDYVYKLKRPVRFAFADFSDPAHRAWLCAEELRLNRHYAPSLYLDVVAVRRDPRGRFRFFHRADLIALLETGAQAAGVELLLGHKVDSVELGAGDPAVMVGGRRVQAPLLIGADGLHSQVRAALNGTATPFFTGQRVELSEWLNRQPRR